MARGAPAHPPTRTRTWDDGVVPVLATVTTSVPAAGTPQPNSRETGSVLEPPGGTPRPPKADVPGIGRGEALGIGVGVGRGTGRDVGPP